MSVPHVPRPMPWSLLCQGDNLATAARVTPRACRGHPESPARRKPAKYMTSAPRCVVRPGQVLQALKMRRQYEPGKVPVVLIHGCCIRKP
jgi:hypothetical protein